MFQSQVSQSLILSQHNSTIYGQAHRLQVNQTSITPGASQQLSIKEKVR